MARVTTEDCITSIPNRFELVIYSCRRARELLSGNEANVAIDNDKQTVIALREIADKKIDLTKIWEDIVSTSQKYQPAEDADINDDQAVPLNENASQVSFDNFEKENASEKKRKRIYMTETEIQKLIDNRKSEKDDSDNLVDEASDEEESEIDNKTITEQN
jgi:DNA-directed RNA polymerase subunit omega|tara:strand:+ start:53 stop:535 length:483 start_codon:yes stop_codon:yes gene_type:complete